MLTVCLGGSLGVYVNLLTGQLLDVKKGQYWLAFTKLGWWNGLVIIAVTIIFLQDRLTTASSKALFRMRDQLVQSILAAASQSLVFPHRNRHVRAIVTIYDTKTKQRVTKYQYNSEPDRERVATFPADFGITGEAFTTKSVVSKELPPDHHKLYPPEIQRAVSPDVKTVLAAPILDPDRPEALPLGILAFDSPLPMSSLKFDTTEARKASQEWADIIATLLTAEERA